MLFRSGQRRLPIIIGMFEAQAIAIEIEKIVPNRPMTHDLFKSFAAGFNFNVEEIIISGLKEGVFYGKIVCSDGVKKIEVDARPSDAIAIGLRFDVAIYTYESILSEAGIVLADGEDTKKTPSTKPAKRKEETAMATTEKSNSEVSKDTNAEQLKAMLDKALAQEDYERAAKIRDELNKRN